MFRFVNNYEFTEFEAASRKNQHFFANLYKKGWGSLFKTVRSRPQTPENSLLRLRTILKNNADLI